MLTMTRIRRSPIPHGASIMLATHGRTPKSGELRRSLRYDHLCNEQGGYDKFQLKKDDSESTLFPFLNNISNINGHDDLNPFMSP